MPRPAGPPDRERIDQIRTRRAEREESRDPFDHQTSAPTPTKPVADRVDTDLADPIVRPASELLQRVESHPGINSTQLDAVAGSEPDDVFIVVEAEVASTAPIEAAPQDVFVMMEGDPVMGVDPVDSDPDGYYMFELTNVQDGGAEPPDGDMSLD